MMRMSIGLTGCGGPVGLFGSGAANLPATWARTNET